MNIEVKNAVDCLLMTCREIDSRLKNGGNYLEHAVITDLHSFIRRISKAGGDKRVASFDNTYLNDGVSMGSEKGPEKNVFPSALPDICRLDSMVFKREAISLFDIYLSAFTELGKYYSKSKDDCKDIDTSAYLSTIQAMKEYGSFQDSTEQDMPAETHEFSRNENSTDGPDTSASDNSSPDEETEETLDELMEQLNALIGLAGVKDEVGSLINLLKLRQIRAERGLKQAEVSKHLVFLGNPGTGKTTVARLLSKIYKQLGALEKGQLIEVDRAGLVAGYVGQTALKTKEIIDEAMGGILFIDEAYTLAKDDTDFGQEAIDTLLKAMEDNRDSFVVVVAGYPEPMEKFLESNPGLKSRFSKNIFFEDYSESELLAIFKSFCDQYGMQPNADAYESLKKHLHELCQNKPHNFANGREMRNLFEAAYTNQANRLADFQDVSSLSNDALSEITAEDLSF